MPGCGCFPAALAADGIEDIVDVQLVPFGNALYNQSEGGKLDCQHGDVECVGNSFLQCAIDEYPDQKTHLKFALCFERYGPYFWGFYNDTADPGHLRNFAKVCAWQHDMDYAKIEACVDDPVRSASLQHKYRDLTKQSRGLFPDVWHLTWVSINGKEDTSDGAELLKEVCAAYTGSPPPGCSNNTSAIAKPLARYATKTMSGARCIGGKDKLAPSSIRPLDATTSH